MAQFDTEYQRLEASYSDSPPGEEDLLVHVPEGSKCEFLDMTARTGTWGENWWRDAEGARGFHFFGALTSLLLSPQDMPYYRSLYPQHLGTTSKTLTSSSLEYPLCLCVGALEPSAPL